MHYAKTLEGQELVVLTPDEFAQLTEDAGDIALIMEAHEADDGRPTMPDTVAAQYFAGEIGGIEAWRRACGLTIAVLSEQSGVRAATISDIENSKVDPRLSTLRALAGVMNVAVGDLVD